MPNPVRVARDRIESRKKGETDCSAKSGATETSLGTTAQLVKSVYRQLRRLPIVTQNPRPHRIVGRIAISAVILNKRKRFGFTINRPLPWGYYDNHSRGTFQVEGPSVIFSVGPGGQIVNSGLKRHGG